MNPAGVLLLSTCLVPPAEALSVPAVHGGQRTPGQARAIASVELDARRVAVEARSEFQFSAAEARQEAEARLRDELIRSITARTACRIRRKALLDQLPVLAYSPEVCREESSETVEKPYGTMHRHLIRLRVEDDALNRWVANVVRQHNASRRLCAAAAALTVLGWMLGLVVVVRLDRWTRGYHRPAILAATLVVLACATAAAWAAILT